MRSLRRLGRRDDGQVALETLLVFGFWFVLLMLLFNFLLIVGSLMLNQATVNRGALQISALGCMPANLRDELEDRSYFGTGDVTIRATSIDIPPGGSFNRDDHLFADGELDTGGSAEKIQLCNVERSSESSSSYIYVQASYEQSIILLEAFGLDSSFDVHRNALVVSNSLEDL